MKTLLRYLAGTKPMVLTLRPKIIPHSKQTTFDIDTYVYSDWAGCATSRRSTSGMALYFLGTLINSQSRTQATVALSRSSGEAELYAIGLGVSESLFIRSLLLESQLSKNVNIRTHTDSAAGKSMATRFGTSKKTKHVQLRFLLIQELVASAWMLQQCHLGIAPRNGKDNVPFVSLAASRYHCCRLLQNMSCKLQTTSCKSMSA